MAKEFAAHHNLHAPELTVMTSETTRDFPSLQELQLSPPEAARPFYLPETTTYVERIGNPLRMRYTPDTRHFYEDDRKARHIFGQMLEHEHFHKALTDIDLVYRDNIKKIGYQEARHVALSELSGKVVFENGAYIYIRERMLDNQAILSPREVESLYTHPYMKSELKKDKSSKTIPDGLIFEEKGGISYLLASVESTAMSGNIFIEPDDDEIEIQDKTMRKERQLENKQEQIYRNGTVPKQLLSDRSHAWREHIGRSLNQRFDISPNISVSPDFHTILVIPKGQPSPVEINNGFELPIPIYRGMISEFSECVLHDLDTIHNYSQESMPNKGSRTLLPNQEVILSSAAAD